jgi:hypothetical protein
MMTNPRRALIKSDDIDTARGDHSSEGTAPVTAASPSTIGQSHPTIRGGAGSGGRQYGAPMTTSANTVIDAIEERAPELSEIRQHLLLFFCQGHHLADLGAPLFAEPLYATLSGVHVDLEAGEPEPDTTAMNNQQLGTVGYVLHRYHSLSIADLSTLVVASSAWQLARQAGDDARIEWMWLTDWFRRPAEMAGKPTAEDADELAAFRKARAGG